MSRVGKNPVDVPEGVTVSHENNIFTAKGKLGELSFVTVSDVEMIMDDSLVRVKPRNNTKRAHKMWGTTRSLINNLVIGVSEGFRTELEIQGVGYKAQIQGKTLNLALGYSHEINFVVPEGIEIKTPSPTVIEISGADKQKIGQVASEIRGFRPPEPYKGKGIRYRGEHVLRKEGKKK